MGGRAKAAAVAVLLAFGGAPSHVLAKVRAPARAAKPSAKPPAAAQAADAAAVPEPPRAPPGMLTIAVGRVDVRGLDEARQAMVGARFVEMGTAIGGVRVVRLPAEAQTTPASEVKLLCAEGRMAAADVVLAGSLVLAGETGHLVLQRVIVSDCRATQLEFPVARRQESTLVAAIDNALCTVVHEGGNRDACRSTVSFEGDVQGVTVQLGEGRHAIDRVGQELTASVGTWPVRACAGAACSETGWVDVQLGGRARLAVSRECGTPVLVEPGRKPLCDTVLVPVPTEMPETAPGSRVRWTAVGTAAAGVVAAAAGAIFGWRARTRAGEITTAYNSPGGLVPADGPKLDEMRSDATLANALLLGGGVVAAGGAALFFF